jgi:prepilin-type processing-associated H-X9-DG protein
LSGQALSLVNNAGSPETITTIDTDGTLAANSDVYLATQKATKTYADLKLAKASNLSDVADAATAFGNIKQSATTAATGVVALGTTTEAIAGADTSKVITPETLKYVLDTMLAQTNDIGDPGQMGFGVGICPPELLPTGFTGMPGYNIKGHSNYGNYLYSDGSVMVWIPWHVYRIAHASNPTYTDYGVNSVDIKSAIDYPWKRIRVSAITAANPAVVTTETPHGRTAGDYIWLSHITSDANWAPYSGQLYKVGTVGSTTTFNLQTAAGVDVDSSGYGGAFSNAAADLKACIVYTGAEAAGYAVHRAFIDGGILQQGYMYDKYKNSKVVKGTGYISGSIKNGLPISTHADHNKISDLTAVTNNYYYETITAAHARDGTDGAVNASSIFHEKSIFQSADIALLSLAHGQAAKTLATTTTYCAWYHATYNFPKGLNNNQAPSGGVISNADANDSSLTFESDGYSNCGKTGSGSPFAKTTHNGQNCGVADVNGLMHETAIGLTAVSSSLNIIAASKADPCVIQTSAAHGLSDNDYVRIASVGGMTQLNDKIYKVTIVDADEFSLQGVNSSSYSDYTAGGTAAKATWYIAKPSTAMKTFTSDNTEVTGHWGATGVAAMMDAFTPVFETSGGGAFAQRMGSGSNQVLSESLYGANWLLTGIGSPKDADGIDTTGTDLFGKDYYYQYVINELCLLAAGTWNDTTGAGAWSVHWYGARSGSSDNVGARAACYPE